MIVGVTGIDSDLRCPGLRSGDSKLIVEMDIRNQRQRTFLTDLSKTPCSLHIGHGKTGDLAAGGGNFFDGWMKNPHSAMISCNDGFRPVSFYLEAIEDDGKER